MIRNLIQIAAKRTNQIGGRKNALPSALNSQNKKIFYQLFSSESVNNNEAPELKMENILREELGADHVKIEDISGGCGSMYKMFVVSEEFEGLNKIKQHRLVQRALASEIADMHGLILDTMPASKYSETE